MEMIKVSVVIPVYNAEKYLCECLDSAAGQTLRDVEILCIDDGSTDNSAAVVAQYIKKDPRIRLIRQENSGSGAARNRGIRTARGEYIAFLDADDFYPEAATLEKLYRAAVEHGVMICGGSFSVVQPDGTVVTRFDPARYWGYTFSEDGLWQYRDYQFDFGYHRFLYRRDFLLEKGLFFPDYLRYQDPPFFVRAMTEAGSFYALRDVSYRYRMGTGPRGITASRRKAWGQLMGYADNLEHAKAHGFLRLYRLTFERCYLDNWHLVLAAARFHDAELDRALQRLDRAVDLSLLPELGRFDKWRYEKDCRARAGKKRPSVWSVGPFVTLTMTAWRALYSIKENGVRYFVYRLKGSVEQRRPSHE